MTQVFKTDRKHEHQNGFVVALCTLLMLVFFIMASFVIDIGNARYNLRKIQIAADACSYAALIALGSTTNYSAVRNIVNDIALRNDILQSEIDNNRVTIDCGIWSSGAFTSQGVDGSNTPICNATTNAVKVKITRQVNTFFQNIVNVASITPGATSISSIVPVNRCIRPFVISNRLLTVSGTPLVPGDTFDSGLLSAGNWGKLDPDPNSGGSGFGNNSMSSDACDPAFASGPADTEQGFSSVKQAFANAIANPAYANGMVFAVTSANPQGNSPNTVPIVEYIKADLIAVFGNNANDWHATFRVVARNVVPNVDPNFSARTLVK